MTPTKMLARLVAVTVVTGSVYAASPAVASTAQPEPIGLAAAYDLAPCVSGGPTSADGALASRLNALLGAKMRGYMDAYRVSCARKVIEAVRARGLHERAAVIAITTTIVETGIRNISEEVDHDSLGLFQQRASWGTVAERLNPSVATNKFLSKMLTKYPNNTWRTAPIGEVCQAVQVSAYPSRYQPEAGDAQIIVDVLSNRVSLSDYNGDGTSEIAVFRPSIREWHSYGKVLARDWGQPGDIPLAGDYDGDGTSDIA
ncbi:hypothetical protein ACFQGL_32160, partial [Micromonospora vulcania]